MAKSRAYRWNGWRTDLNGGVIKDHPDAPKKKPVKGITNSQAKTLASLDRRLGRSYSGRGLTSKQASAAISEAIREKQRRRDAQ